MLIRGRQPFHMVGQTAEIQVKCGPHSKIVQYMRMHVEGKGYFLRQFAGQIKIIWRAECGPRAVGWLRLQSRSRTPVYYDSVSSFRHRHLTIFRQFDTNQGKKQLNLIKKKLIITERYTLAFSDFNVCVSVGCFLQLICSAQKHNVPSASLSAKEKRPFQHLPH